MFNRKVLDITRQNLIVPTVVCTSRGYSSWFQIAQQTQRYRTLQSRKCGFRKFWHAFSGNSGTICRRRPYLVQLKLTRAARDPIELDKSSPLQDTIQDSSG